MLTASSALRATVWSRTLVCVSLHCIAVR